MYAGWISLIVGILARVFVPWLAKRQLDPEGAEWDFKKYVLPQLLSFVLILILLPLIVSELDTIGGLPWQAAWLAGWGAGDIGRQTYKRLANDE